MNILIKRSQQLAVGGYFISTVGSYLFSVTLSLFLLRESKSALASALPFALQWGPSLVLVFFGSHWTDKVRPKVLWILTEILSAVVIGIIVLMIANGATHYALVPLLFLRGIIEHFGRIVKTVSIKTFFPEEYVAMIGSNYQLAFYAGMGTAGMLGGWLIERNPIVSVGAMCTLCFILACICIGMLREFCQADSDTTVVNQTNHTIQIFTRCIKENPEYRFTFLALAVISILLQGSYTVIQTVYPLHVLKLTESHVSVLFGLTNVALIIGIGLFKWYNHKLPLMKWDATSLQIHLLKVIGMASLAYMLAVAASGMLLPMSMYLTMIILYEYAFLVLFIKIVVITPKNILGRITTMTIALCTFGQSMMVLVVGYLIDLAVPYTIIVCGVSITVTALYIILIRSQSLQTQLSKRIMA